MGSARLNRRGCAADKRRRCAADNCRACGAENRRGIAAENCHDRQFSAAAGGYPARSTGSIF